MLQLTNELQDYKKEATSEGKRSLVESESYHCQHQWMLLTTESEREKKRGEKKTLRCDSI